MTAAAAAAPFAAAAISSIMYLTSDVDVTAPSGA